MLTTEQKLENLHLARRLWQARVRPENVNLQTWGCGTHACFGGWLATWPEFQAMGVAPDGDGTPTLVYESSTDDGRALPRIAEGNHVAVLLFGSYLFSVRGGHPADPSAVGSDYDVVTQRLDWDIKVRQRQLLESAS